jgi:hypothetical protein
MSQKNVLLLCLLLLVCIHATWSGREHGTNTKRMSAAAHHLHLVYGAERIQSHFTSQEELDQAVQATQESHHRILEKLNLSPTSSSHHRTLSASEDASEGEDSDSSGSSSNTHRISMLPQLACVLYPAAALAKEALVLAFGADRVSTVHVSRSDNRACFLVVCSPSDLLMLTGGPTSLTPDADYDSGAGAGSASDFDSDSAVSFASFKTLGNIDFV